MLILSGFLLFVTAQSGILCEEIGADIITRLKALEETVERQNGVIHQQVTQIKDLQETVAEQKQSISYLKNEVEALASDNLKKGHGFDVLMTNSNRCKRTLKRLMKIVKSSYSKQYTDRTECAGNADKTSGIQRLQGVNNIKKRFVLDTVETVAFEATVTGSNKLPHSHVNDRIIFETVSLNVGSSYHAGNGTFIAPIPGIYIFSTSVMMMATNTNDNGMHVIIEKNGVEIAGAYAYNSIRGTYEHSSVTVATKLQPGDSVFVSVERHDDISFYGDNLTSFMGFLLLPL